MATHWSAASGLAMPDFLTPDEAALVRLQLGLSNAPTFHPAKAKQEVESPRRQVDEEQEESPWGESEDDDWDRSTASTEAADDSQFTPHRRQYAHAYGATLDTTAEVDDEEEERQFRPSPNQPRTPRNRTLHFADLSEIESEAEAESQRECPSSPESHWATWNQKPLQHEFGARRSIFASMGRPRVHSVSEDEFADAAASTDPAVPPPANVRRVQTGGGFNASSSACSRPPRRNSDAKSMTAEEELDGRTTAGVHFRPDGSIDPKPKLVVSGDLLLKQDGKADLRSKTFRQQDGVRLKPTADSAQSSSERPRPKWTAEQIAASFSKLEQVPGADPSLYRQDRNEKVLDIRVYGQRQNPLGSEVDHSRAKDLGGTEHPNNLYLAQGQDNASKGSKTAAQLSKRGETRFGIKASDLSFSPDGTTILPDSKAVADGRLDLVELQKARNREFAEGTTKRNQKVQEIIAKQLPEKETAGPRQQKAVDEAARGAMDKAYEAIQQRRQAQARQAEKQMTHAVQQAEERQAERAAALAAAKREAAAAASQKVQVSGYTRANGTIVDPYTRAPPSAGTDERSFAPPASSRTSVLDRDEVHVREYTRASGTVVQAHTRAYPTPRERSSASANVPAAAPTQAAKPMVHVSGYTRANGTVVAAYTRAAPGYGSSSSSSSSSSSYSKSYSSSAQSSSGVVHVSGYTRSNGTYVAGYTRSAPSRK